MRLDKLTNQFQLAISDAQSLAVGRDHQYIEPAHLFVALLNQENGTVRSLMTLLNVEIAPLKTQVLHILDKIPRVTGNFGDVQLSQNLAKLFNQCDKLAQQRQDAFISSELFVLA
ncbi:MAG: Clp protease N-terminal domain-containing protein, partial [Enterovibrio sp.]